MAAFLLPPECFLCPGATEVICGTEDFIVSLYVYARIQPFTLPIFQEIVCGFA